jgi:HEAT repeat protein
LRFCYARQNDSGEYELPKQVLPFLLEALHAHEIPPDSYPCIALSQVEPDAAVPAILEVLSTDDDPHARKGARMALTLMGGAKAVPALRRALNDENEETRKLAAELLWYYGGSPHPP